MNHKRASYVHLHVHSLTQSQMATHKRLLGHFVINTMYVVGANESHKNLCTCRIRNEDSEKVKS